MKKLKFTEAAIKNIPVPESREEYQDSELSWFRLRVSPSGAKSFQIFKRLKGGTNKRVTIGRFDNGMRLKEARQLAIEYAAMLSKGSLPSDIALEKKIKSVTLDFVFSDYVSTKTLKPKTLKEYKSLYQNYFQILSGRLMSEIKRADIEKWFNSIPSPAQANGSYRLLNALFNYSKEAYLDSDGRSLIPDNPTGVITHKGLLHKVARKQTHIRSSELPRFYSALNSLRGVGTISQKSICDAMLFALLTGLRKEEVLSLKWEHVNSHYFEVFENKAGRLLELPITPYLQEIIERDRFVRTDFVFPSDNKFGRVIEPKKTVDKLKQMTSLSCGWHDLRRTFLTIGESLGIGRYTLKRLANHALSDDVTEGYLILTSETLLEPSVRIQKRIFELMH